MGGTHEDGCASYQCRVDALRDTSLVCFTLRSGAFPDDLPTGGSTGWPVVKCCSPATIQWTAWPPLYRSASGRHHGTACGRPTVVQPDPPARLVDLGAIYQAWVRCEISERQL
jgi:hypothetical protein